MFQAVQPFPGASLTSVLRTVTGSPTLVRLNNQRALAAYKPAGVLSCPIVIFSTAQPLSPEEHHCLGIEDLPATEWQRY